MPEMVSTLAAVLCAATVHHQQDMPTTVAPKSSKVQETVAITAMADSGITGIKYKDESLSETEKASKSCFFTTVVHALE